MRPSSSDSADFNIMHQISNHCTSVDDDVHIQIEQEQQQQQQQQQSGTMVKEALDVAAAARFKVLLDQTGDTEIAGQLSPKRRNSHKYITDSQQPPSLESSPSLIKKRLAQTRDSQSIMRTRKSSRPPPLLLEGPSEESPELPVVLLPVRTSSRRAMHDCAMLGLDSQLYNRSTTNAAEQASQGTISTFSLRVPLYSPLPLLSPSPVPPVPLVPYVLVRTRPSPSYPNTEAYQQDYEHTEEDFGQPNLHKTESVTRIQRSHTQREAYKTLDETSDVVRRTRSVGSKTAKKSSTGYTDFATWAEEVAASNPPTRPSTSPPSISSPIIDLPEIPPPAIFDTPSMSLSQAPQSIVTLPPRMTATNRSSQAAPVKAPARSVCFSPFPSSPSSTYSSSRSNSSSTRPPGLSFIPSSPSSISSPTMATPHVSGSSTKSTKHHRRKVSLFGWFRPRGRLRMMRTSKKKGTPPTEVDDLIDLYFRDDGSVLSEASDIHDHDASGDENHYHDSAVDEIGPVMRPEPERAHGLGIVSIDPVHVSPTATLRSRSTSTRKKRLGFF